MRASNRWYTAQTLLTILLTAGCSDVLDVHPINDTDASQAITSPGGARAAVAGLYDALQGTDVEASYYGGEMLFFGDLSADDVEHVGTFTTYRQIDQNDITSDNGGVEGFWDAMYKAVGRANIVIEKVPGVQGLDPVERDDLLGQAYFIRALSYHNLVKFWGDTAAGGLGVPIVLVQPKDVSEAGLATRATTGEVYGQILSDLGDAETLLDPGADDPHRVTVMAIHALRARVYLYQKNYVGAETEAQAVTGFSLAPQYGDLFTPEGDDTPEDIFRLHFDAVDYSWEGYYYRHDEASFGGRREIAPAFSLIKAYDSAYTGLPTTYNPTDLRGQWNISFVDPTDGESVYGSKWPTGIGAENIQVFRLAEVLLIQAEAEARQSKLAEAEATLTPIRTRAGLASARLDTLTGPTAQARAINIILRERRLELAMEGDRWPDLVRNGLVQTVMPGVAAFQNVYPIPLNELDVAPGLVQNPGY